MITEQIKVTIKRTRTGFMTNIRAEQTAAQPIYVGYIHDAGSHYEYPIAFWNADLNKYNNNAIKSLLPENAKYCLGSLETNEDRDGNEIKLVKVFINGAKKGLIDLVIYPEDLKQLKIDGQRYCSSINNLEFID